MRPTYVATAVAYVFPAHMCLTSVFAYATLKCLCAITCWAFAIKKAQK